jgi:large subunit ribosomal protein L10
LTGPSAIAFVKGDPVETAKGLREFARTNPLLVIKGGVLEGKLLSADEIRRLADLESREVLLAKLAGALKASLSGAVSLFAAPLSQTARLIEALRQKAADDPSILAGGSGETSTPVAESEASAPDSVDASVPGVAADVPAAAENADASAVTDES